jgi:hypothetical protein
MSFGFLVGMNMNCDFNDQMNNMIGRNQSQSKNQRNQSSNDIE